jgi:site-specific recombinase XerD
MRRSATTAPRIVPPTALAAASAAAWACCPRDGMIMETLIETAIRNTECRLLILDDVWRDGQAVLSLKIRPEIAKNSKPRTIPLTKSYRAKLTQYVMNQHEHTTGTTGPCPLFPSQKGLGFLTRRGLCRIVKAHLAAAGHTGTPHQLRHTAATDLIRVTNVRVVQLILGHARMDTVQIYTHPSDDDLRDAMEARGTRNANHATPLKGTANEKTS